MEGRSLLHDEVGGNRSPKLMTGDLVTDQFHLSLLSANGLTSPGHGGGSALKNNIDGQSTEHEVRDTGWGESRHHDEPQWEHDTVMPPQRYRTLHLPGLLSPSDTVPVIEENGFTHHYLHRWSRDPGIIIPPSSVFCAAQHEGEHFMTQQRELQWREVELCNQQQEQEYYVQEHSLTYSEAEDKAQAACESNELHTVTCHEEARAQVYRDTKEELQQAAEAFNRHYANHVYLYVKKPVSPPPGGTYSSHASVQVSPIKLIKHLIPSPSALIYGSAGSHQDPNGLLEKMSYMMVEIRGILPLRVKPGMANVVTTPSMEARTDAWQDN